MQSKWKIAAGFGAGALVAVFALHPPLTSQDWAAWIGAIGTVAAFFAAVGVARWQFSWAHEKARRDDEAKLQALLALAYDYVYLMKIATMRMRAPEAGNIVPPSPLSLAENFDDIVQGVKAFPLHQFPVPDYVPLMLIFRRYARRTAHDLASCEKQFHRGNLNQQEIDYVEKEIAAIRHRARYVLAEIRAGVRQYGCVPHEPPEYLTDLTNDWRGTLYDVE